MNNPLTTSIQDLADKHPWISKHKSFADLTDEDVELLSIIAKKIELHFSYKDIHIVDFFEFKKTEFDGENAIILFTKDDDEQKTSLANMISKFARIRVQQMDSLHKSHERLKAQIADTKYLRSVSKIKGNCIYLH